MPSIQAYKAHEQEGTLVSKVHKQGALSTSSQAVLGRCAECPLFVHLAYQCSFLFVCFVGLYAGHPYIHLISFEIFLLACSYKACSECVCVYVCVCECV